MARITKRIYSESQLPCGLPEGSALPMELVKGKEVPFSCARYCRQVVSGCDNCIIQKCFDKLADYEDAEEKGHLINIPFALGDHVWFVDDYGILRELTILDILVGAGGWKFLADTESMRMFYDFDLIGKSIFLTKEEAEAKLKELETENDKDRK